MCVSPEFCTIAFIGVVLLYMGSVLNWVFRGKRPHCGVVGVSLRWPGLASFCCCASRKICCPCCVDPKLVILTMLPVCGCCRRIGLRWSSDCPLRWALCRGGGCRLCIFMPSKVTGVEFCRRCCFW